MVQRPFIDINRKILSTTLQFYSDASLREDLGFGARFNESWIFQQWPKNFIHDKSPSIEYAELYALCVAVLTWADKLMNKGQVTIFCDNQSVLPMVNNTTAGCKNSMVLIRKIAMVAMQYNFRLNAEYIESKKNEVSDALSRLQWFQFRKLQKKLKLNPLPDQLPEEVWPVTNIWID